MKSKNFQNYCKTNKYKSKPQGKFLKLIEYSKQVLNPNKE